ncbi:hypothetical protein KHC33_00245 [Methanospirillum sp. J.3.6.1-F.2.7.3]|uniref:Uncharacterized protein n=1 Tax=Methanospirillum purgamenti TaxID=2834276 RepID=A0A8E7EHH9_9EURY|nr:MULTISPECIES: hypothetical protein [Methanospirillum]MDX8549624.1 hypothetical protein [Methanospirillum hungatei]QVV89007.1 hypothetical protein KHC33_00245 [Methanospirillum sp. J.3.6.1-F.2.7.3]
MNEDLIKRAMAEFMETNDGKAFISHIVNEYLVTHPEVNQGLKKNNNLICTITTTPHNTPAIHSTSLPFIRSCLGDDLVDRALAAGIVRVI